MTGFSMLCDTQFGAFGCFSDSSRDRWIEDPTVGLKLRVNAVDNCRVLGNPDLGDIQFCVSLESGVELLVSNKSCRKDNTAVVDRIENTFGIDGSPGAAPWLDEWPAVPDYCHNCPFACYRAADLIARWNELSVIIETPDLSIYTRLTPGLADLNDRVLRIFDSSTLRVIYVDLALPTLSLFSTDDCAGCLRLGPNQLN